MSGIGSMSYWRVARAAFAIAQLGLGSSPSLLCEGKAGTLDTRSDVGLAIQTAEKRAQYVVSDRLRSMLVKAPAGASRPGS